MGTVYKPTYTKPLPENAELITSGGRTLAKVKPAKGRTQTFPVTTGSDGTLRIVRTSATYVAKFRNGLGLEQKVSTGCRDESAARSILKELERKAELVRSGVVSADEAQIADHGCTPLADHVAGWLTCLDAKEVTETYREDCRRYLERLSTECGFNRLSDLNREKFSRWLAEQKATGMSARSRNVHQTALVAFCNWCVETQRLSVNPFAGMHKANEKADPRRQRRALTEGELCRLLEVARERPLIDAKTIRRGKRKGQTVAKLSPEVEARLTRVGQERALIYKTLVLTGLRLNELRSLTIGQLELNNAVPFAKLDAKDEKNRQGSDIPLRVDLADDLREWIKLRQAAFCGSDVDFKRLNVLTVPTGLRKILDRDLVAAGIARMVTDEETGKQRIDKRDDRGRTIDVHALRHTFGTWLSKGGVPLRTAQAAMRHSTPTLTANVYTDPRLLDVHGALNALPSLPLKSSPDSQELRATGTMDERQLVPLLVPTLVHGRESESHPVTGRSSRVDSEKPSAVAVTACSDTKKDSLSLSDNESFKIGMTRFERATSCSQSRRSSQAELHPVCASESRVECRERQFGRETLPSGYPLCRTAVAVQTGLLAISRRD